MGLTSEQIKQREFPIRLKGYDPDEVRRFLDQVAASFRAVIGTDVAPTGEDAPDLLSAARAEADRLVTEAQHRAATLAARIEEKHRQASEEADRARRILERSQEREATINEDCRAASRTLADAQQQAEQIVAQARDDASAVVVTERAEADAAQLRQRLEQQARERLEQVDALADRKLKELDDYVAAQRAEADEDRRRGQATLERAKAKAHELMQETQKRISAMTRLAELETRNRLAQVDQEIAELRRTAEEEAQAQVAEILAEAQQRVVDLREQERDLDRRVGDANADLRDVVERVLGPVSRLDLTSSEPVVAFEGTYDEQTLDVEVSDDRELEEVVEAEQARVDAMVASAVGRARQHGAA